MAAFNFPNSPSDGDTHTENGLTYVWDGTNGAWKRSPASLSKGVKGDKGDAGTDGDKGSKGDNKGEQGDKGEPGDVTAKGAKGEPGDKGNEGDKGDKGDVEAQGNKGDEGQKGEPGDKGDEGVKGETGSTGAGMAVGGIVAWSGSASSLPDGYFLCDGSAKSRTTYDALYAVIGTTHGAGDGSTTFNLPDLSGRFVVGYDSNNNIFDVADKGGSADATLVAHGHTINDPGHFHTTVDYVARSGYAEPRNFGVGTDGNANNTGNTNSKTTGITINSNGSSATNANLPPYYALAYIIQYAQGGDVAKGQKGEAGSDGTNGTDGDKGQKGEAGADNSTKGQKGEAGSGGGDSVWETTSAGINTSSNVGIGTDLSGSGTHLLHVFNGTGCGSQSSGIGEVVIESNNAATIQLLSPSSAAIPQTIFFGDESSGQVGRLQYDHSDDSMLFKTNGNNRRFRLNSSGDADFSGNVGIGTNLSGSNTHLLHLFNGTGCGTIGAGTGELVVESNNAATIQLLSPSGDINPQTIYFGDESSGESGRIQYSHSSDSMIFKTNGNNERLRITSTGQLNIAGDMQFTAANPELEFNVGGPRFRVPGDNTLAIHKGGGLGATDDEVVRITQGGNVGIGTTNPNAVVGAGNTIKLAVGIVTCHQLYVNGNEITGSGGSGSGGSSEPVGTIVAWAGSVASIPNGYQLCDGSAAVTATLQTITGTNVPDLRDRFIIGANDVAAESAYPGVGIGSTGGSADAVVVEHKHTTSFDGKKYFPGGGSTNIGYGGAGSYPADTFSMDNQGVSGTNKNLPPYYALCYIIKHTATSSSGSGGTFELLSEKSATGTEVEFTGIPSDALEITVMFRGVSLNANNNMLVQLGYSNSWIASGYVSNSENTNGSDEAHSTNGFAIFGSSDSAEFHGSMIINKSSSSSYTEIGEFRKANSGGCHARGSLSSVSGTVERLKVTIMNQNNQDAFDAGTISVSYKTSGSGGNSQSGTSKVAILKDQKGNQASGGTFTGGGWRDRDLTVEEDPSNFVTFTAGGSTGAGSSGNTPGYWSLPAGDYKIDWTAPAFSVSRHKSRLVYSTTQSHISTAGLDASASFVEGTSVHTGTANASTDSTGHTIINLTQTTWFKVMHYCSTTESDAGFGRKQSSNANSATGDNVYTQVRIEDLATVFKSGVTIGDKIEEGNTKAEVVDTGTDGKFVVTTEGVERVRITPSGQFLVGATSADVDNKMLIQDSGTTILKINNTDDGTAQITLANTGSSNGQIKQISGDMTFSIAGNEKTRITSSGLVAIKSTGQLINESGLGVRSAGNTCVLKAEGNRQHNPLICWNNFSGGNSAQQIQFGDGTTYGSRGSITTNGSTVTYGGTSDYRLKQDEVLITDGIEKVKLLKPRRFKWKNNLDLGICDGFFAHEIEEATPTSQASIGTKDAVATESDVNVGLATSIGDPIYQQVDQSKLIPILTAALKEAIAKIETLETKVTALEG